MDTTFAGQPRVFKRYQNRKFYDAIESRYVNFDEIASVIKAGSRVQVLDSETLSDVTGMTLARILSREEKRATRTCSETLCDLIRAATGEASHPVDDDAPPAPRPAEAAESRAHAAEHLVDALLNRGRRAAWIAHNALATSKAALGRLDERARGRAEAAAGVIAAIEKLNRQLSRAGERLDGLHEELRTLEDE